MAYSVNGELKLMRKRTLGKHDHLGEDVPSEKVILNLLKLSKKVKFNGR